MKIFVVLPLIFSIISFVLSLLALLSGYKPGFMEEYNLLTLNTSALGVSAVQNVVSGSDLIPDALAGILGDIGGEIANSLADQIGIEEFYSIHAMDYCSGSFVPNATTDGASHNVSECSKPLDYGSYNLSAKLSEELSLGPFNFSLSDLGVTDSIQEKLNELPKLAKALAAIFITTAVVVGLTMLMSIVEFAVSGGRLLSFFNFLLAGVAATLLLASALVATIGPPIAIDQINQNGGEEIGLDVITSNKLLSLIWAAFALMLMTMVFFFVELVVECVRKRRTGGFRSKEVYTK